MLLQAVAGFGPPEAQRRPGRVVCRSLESDSRGSKPMDVEAERGKALRGIHGRGQGGGTAGALVGLLSTTAYLLTSALSSLPRPLML